MAMLFDQMEMEVMMVVGIELGMNNNYLLFNSGRKWLLS